MPAVSCVLLTRRSMLTLPSVLELLSQIMDPEVPVDIVRLGLVKKVEVDDAGHVRVELAPCYASCPGRSYMLEEVRRLLREVDREAEVTWSSEPHWSSSLVTAEGVRRLREFGVGIRQPGATSMTCPHCGSLRTRLEKEFGSTVSMVVFYCEACRNPFEALRGSW